MTSRESIPLRPIGVVRSQFISKVGVPIQTAGSPSVPGELDVVPEFVQGLKDLDQLARVLTVGTRNGLKVRAKHVVASGKSLVATAD